ncbi:hypothetical protein TOPH_08888 [Tolypocladium ophioglossoides CBS 100239]|uniref:Fungal-type protein kinase domain-containing protein n=1 Tax=Tolypocladium ophioglossoides (strain CBS 100239) TaxID=1163406 RepID=A0A0L0MYC3_TOLOC|nr:hypothetical protein TOPH_08888 [Tolypocladium ophioglossoides CBS 100239]
MALSKDLLKIIAENPLGETLKDVRDKLHAGAPPDGILASLLGALVLSTAAFSLPAPEGSGDVAGKLLTMLQSVRGGSLEPEKLRPLVDVVDSPDTDIWATVIDIIKVVNPLTPPSTLAPTFRGTPVKANSSRLSDSETREIVERELFQEIKRCTFRNVKGFWDKFFDPKNWRREQKAMLKGIMVAHNGKKWTDFPSSPDEKPVWDWLRSLEERFLADAPHKLHTTRTANQFKDWKGQMDLFLQTPATKPNDLFQYKHVLVVGEQKKSDDTGKFKATLLQLARYVRGVFADQPTRRFVHGFTLSNSTMELWVFDRSGPYSSGPFDIHGEPDKFARAFVGYCTMDDDAMGLDTFIEREYGHRYITLDDTSGGETRLRLAQAIVRQRAIVCRGTTCYGTRNSHVAKFSWASDKRKQEVEHLKLAEERGVKGVARAVAYRRITTIGTMRKDLEFPGPHRFREEAVQFEDPPLAMASTNTSDCKRKSGSDITSDNVSGSKRRRSSSQSQLAKKLNDQLPTSKSKLSLYTPGENPLLRRWEIGSFKFIAASKAGDMTINGLQAIMGEFPEALDVVKPLCLRIRRTLFGDTAKLFFGTPAGDPGHLYRPIIAAYDEAIGDL